METQDGQATETPEETRNNQLHYAMTSFALAHADYAAARDANYKTAQDRLLGKAGALDSGEAYNAGRQVRAVRALAALAPTAAEWEWLATLYESCATGAQRMEVDYAAARATRRAILGDERAADRAVAEAARA